MANDKQRAIDLTNELLDEARVKRNAIDLAKGQCDVVRVKQMQRDAALMEAAANLIDPSHEAGNWKINP